MNNIFENRDIVYRKALNGLEYIEFIQLLKYQDKVKHCFTTRFGGVSTGECESLNFGFNRNDTKGNILKNFKLLSEALDYEYGSMVISNQIHDNKIKIVNYNDKGKGIIRESDIIGYDGLITDKKGITLVTFYADCVPIYLYDFKKKIISLIHSGWKSTFREISKEALIILKNRFHCDPANIIAVIGPSICKDCFEVGKDLYIEFGNKFGENYIISNSKKYYIDLHSIIKDTLLFQGITQENISMNNVCTKCNKNYFFSYRGDEQKTGSMCAIMQLI